MTKPINQHYFEKESKHMYYVLGAFYHAYTPFKKTGVIFRSRYKDLVELVKDELESGHKIIREKKENSSYSLQIYNTPYLKKRLKDKGLHTSKEKRRFPKDIKKEYASSFARGFIDAAAGINSNNKGYTIVGFYSNPALFSDIHSLLKEHANVQHVMDHAKYLMYLHKDAMRIHDFIYSDWDYIKKNRLYLPETKAKFCLTFELKKNGEFNRIKMQKRIEKTKDFLKKGYTVPEISQMLGYKRSFSLYRAFKSVTGMTLGKWKRENGIEND